MKITITLISLSTLGLLLFTGCASDPVGKMSLNDAVMTGNRTSALADLREKESKVAARDRLQFLLQKGQLEWAEGDLSGALESFAQARVLIDLFDEAAQVSISGSAGDYLVQPGMRPYTPRIADRLHLHHYAALCYLELGYYDAFRVEMRAIQDANERLANLHRAAIEREEALIAKATEETEVGPVDQLPDFLSDPRVAEHFAAVHHVDPVVMARARFESPMLHFLEGLIQAHVECTVNGGGEDAERARVALRMAAEMSPESQTVRNALLLANGDSDTVMAQDRVWVVHENGLAPTLSSVKVAVAFNVPDDQKGMQALALGSMGADLMIPVPVNNPLFGQALFTFPTIQPQAQHLCYPSLIVSSDEGVQRRTHRISSPEEQQLLNFKADLPRAIRVAVIGGMIKAALEQFATKEAGLGGFLLSRMYTQATSASDTRIWSTLPREFQVACMDRPASGVVRISAENGLLQQEPMTVILAPEGMATIIYVSTPGKEAVPVVRVFGLGNHQGQAQIQVVSQVDPLRLLAAGVN